MSILERHSAERELQLELIELVKKFARERRLIIYGGVAVDMALRLKGGKIYEDDALWDVDMLTDDSVKNAYDFVDLLREKGYKEVNAIRAVHIQTMRVRVNSIICADFSFVPKPIFDKIPTLNYQDLLFVHPQYQYTDTHLSFTFPFANPPSENIYNRFSKDLERYRLLVSYYPTIVSEVIDKKLYEERTFDMPSELEYAFTGFVAYNIMVDVYNKMCKMLTGGTIKSKPVKDKKLKKKAASVDDDTDDDSNDDSNDGSSADMPFVVNNSHISMTSRKINATVYTEDPYLEIIVPGMIENITQDHTYLEYIPIYSQNDNIFKRTYALEHQLPTVSLVSVDGINVKIVSAHYLMLYFNIYYFKTGQEIYLQHYVSIYNMIMKIEKLYEDLIEKNPEQTLALQESFINSVFGLNISIMGKKNISHSYLIMVAKSIKACRDIENAKELGYDPRVFEVTENLPEQYYDERPAPFDYKNNKLFWRYY